VIIMISNLNCASVPSGRTEIFKRFGTAIKSPDEIAMLICHRKVWNVSSRALGMAFVRAKAVSSKCLLIMDQAGRDSLQFKLA
jgi:hypothetical protein